MDIARSYSQFPVQQVMHIYISFQINQDTVMIGNLWLQLPAVQL